jgi:hypothetical protein
MNNEPFKVQWELKIEEEDEEAGFSYLLIARLTNLEQLSPRIQRYWLAHIPLAWIREPELRLSFWDTVENGFAKLNIAMRDRELIATRLERVVEPLTEEQAHELNQDPEFAELKKAFHDMIELRDKMDSARTQETETRFTEAWGRAAQLWIKDYEKKKRRYQEDTGGISF